MNNKNESDNNSKKTCAWTSKLRNYEEDTKLLKCKSTFVEPESHPLKPILTESELQKKSTSKSTKQCIDPLSESDALDPLSKMVADASLKEKQELIRMNVVKSSFEPWNFKKSNILAKYTTVEKLSITSSFLTPLSNIVKDNLLSSKDKGTVSDKIKERLEMLDQFEDENMQEMANLTQQEYIKRIEELNSALLKAWNEDDRVKSLKIVIQCSKLLLDTSIAQFYPSKFVLITDILDTFGKLVYERISSKSFYVSPGSSKSQPLPEKFTADIIPAIAKETCRNWFFKIASIRELLPRVYIEAAILKCTNFLSDDSIIIPIKRLVAMTAGIGDPLVASYANCYICRVGVSIDASIKEYQILSLDNVLCFFKKLSVDKFNRLVSTKSSQKNITFKTYLELYSPAIDWVLQCVSSNQPVEYSNQILEKFDNVTTENYVVSGLLINSMMSSFEPNFISSIAPKVVRMIKDCDEGCFSKHILFQRLGMCLVFDSTVVLTEKTKEQKEKNKKDLQLLNEVWKIVGKFEDAASYMSCAEIWIEYTLKNFTKKEINALLGDIIRHIQPNRIFENFYPQLQSIISKILVYVTDFIVLFSMEKFMQFLGLFQKDTIKIEVCKTITNAFLRSKTEYTDDILVNNSMMQICKTMHDYVNALTLEDEKRDISIMICKFINRFEISDKDQIEQYLNFYSDARASFSNLDDVIALLVHRVNKLAIETLRIVNYNHTHKTASFVRACVAFSFITIPSLNNVFLKLQLYLASAQVSALNQCLSQADAFLKSAISIIPDIQMQVDNQNMELSNAFEVNNASKFSVTSITIIEKLLNDYLSNMLSTLLLIPDNPDQGVLYLLSGVINLINKHYSWENLEYKFNLLVNCLIILGSIKQEDYIYHNKNVESNDTLYGSDVKFIKEVNKLIESVLSNVLDLLAEFSLSKQSQLSLEFFNRLISHADLSIDATLELAINLWNLSLKNQSRTKFHEQLLATIKIRSKTNKDYKSLFLEINK